MEEIEKMIIELSKVNEVNEKTARLLFEMGIKSPEDLANADANKIYENLKEFKLSGKVSYLSDIKTIQKWISNAKEGVYIFSFAKIRYVSLKERAFEEELRMLVFKELIMNNRTDINVEEAQFETNDKVKSKFKESFDNMAIVRLNNRKIKDWEAKNEPKLKILKQKYLENFEKNLSYERFLEIYGNDKADRKCYYCEVKESEIKELHDNGLIITKRFYSRGKSHEIDRTNPNGKYELNNIQLCCYWCNNAKTDEFDESDFKPIGNAIGKVWQERLAQIRK